MSSPSAIDQSPQGRAGRRLCAICCASRAGHDSYGCLNRCGGDLGIDRRVRVGRQHERRVAQRLLHRFSWTPLRPMSAMRRRVADRADGAGVGPPRPSARVGQFLDGPVRHERRHQRQQILILGAVVGAAHTLHNLTITVLRLARTSNIAATCAAMPRDSRRPLATCAIT